MEIAYLIFKRKLELIRNALLELEETIQRSKFYNLKEVRALRIPLHVKLQEVEVMLFSPPPQDVSLAQFVTDHKDHYLRLKRACHQLWTRWRQILAQAKRKKDLSDIAA